MKNVQNYGHGFPFKFMKNQSNLVKKEIILNGTM